MSFSPFMYYGDTGRFYVAADDAGNVTATHALSGNGLWVEWGADERIGTIREGSPGVFLAHTPGFPNADGWACDDYADPRHAASALVEWWDDRRADALHEGSDD